jgi:hypothetical protein
MAKFMKNFEEVLNASFTDSFPEQVYCIKFKAKD